MRVDVKDWDGGCERAGLVCCDCYLGIVPI